MPTRTTSRFCSPTLSAAFTAITSVLVITTAAVAQPSNDACQDALEIGPGTVSGTTIGATPDGASSCDAFFARDVWFRYTPKENGTVSTSSCSNQTDFQTVISFHRACPPTQAAEIGCNDGDIKCSDVFQASLSYPVIADETYLLRLTGFGGQTGTFEFTVDGPPVE